MVEELYPNLRIFISHSHKDNTFGHQLFDDLAYFFGRDSCLWYDSKGGLRGGHDWWAEIKKKLWHSNKVIAILSKEAFAGRQWVLHELSLIWPYKVDGRVTIIPIQCDDYKYRGHIDLKSLQTIFCRDAEEYRRHFRDIIKALNLRGDPIADFVKREQEYIRVAYASGDSDRIIRGTQFLLSYFPETASATLYWKYAIALVAKRELQQAHLAFHKGLKFITDSQSYFTWVSTYLTNLFDKGLLTELADFTKELISTSPYPNHVSVAYNQLRQIYLQQKQNINGMPNNTSPTAISSNSGDRVNTQPSTSGSPGSQSDTLVSSQFTQTGSIVADKDKQLASSMGERKTDDFVNLIPTDELDIDVTLGNLDSTSWLDKAKLFIERSRYVKHPLKKISTRSFMGATIFNIICLFIILFTVSFPFSVPILVILFATMLLLGTHLRFGVVGSGCVILLATFWAIGGYLLVSDIANGLIFLSYSTRIIEIVHWLVCIIAGICGGVWHWLLFRE